MNIIHHEVKLVLNQLHSVLVAISNKAYTTPIPILDNSTIGEHSRHVIELFQCLHTGLQGGIINYDNRQRNKVIQTDKQFAVECIDSICDGLIDDNKTIQLQTILAGNTSSLESNYFRELIYNIEHCVHHQAIIKIGLASLGITIDVNNFGVAASTIQYKTQCAQ
jgi:hypothetical protein